MNNATLLIQSQHKNNQSMGTGFIIHQDSFGSYVLTCAHVLEQVDKPKIDGFSVEEKFRGSSETIDLALLYVKGLFSRPFKLQARVCTKGDVYLMGYSSFSYDKYQGKRREATILGEKVTLKSVKDGTTYGAWQMVAKDNHEIEAGNSGGPLVCQESGKVIAVVSNNKGVTEGYAISIEHLKDIWSDAPPFLFESDDEGESPFVGLSAFGIEQSHLFFGRERETEEIIEKLKKENLIAVVGDSGSGKSSVIKAGVIPNYLNGILDEEVGASFHLIDTRPAKDPFHEFASSVTRVAKAFNLNFESVNQMKKAINSKNGEDLLNALEYIFNNEEANLLIYIDQFEELFTLCEDKVQEEFIEVLLYLLKHQTSNLKIKIIFTMRRDYYNLISEHEEFFRQTQASKYTLNRMKDEQIKECIEKPLERTFISKERVTPFAKAVLQDMGDKSSELALLQIALTQTWKHKKEYKNNLLRTYHEIGEVSGALAKLAEDTWRILNPVEQRILKYIFIRIIQPGETGGVTRRLADREEFSEDAWELAQKLSSALNSKGEIASDKNAKLGRLLKIKGEDGNVVELTHEALVGQWPMYQRWLKEVNKNHLKRVHDRVIEKTKSYQKIKKKKFLLMGYELEESMKLLGDDYRDYLSDDEIAYIEKSESQDKKSRFKKRMLLFGLVILTATSIFFGGYAKYQEELANEATLNVQKTLRNSLMEKGRIFQDNPLISKLLFAKALTQEMSRRNKSSDTVLKILYNSFYDIELEEASDDENNSDFGKTTDFMRLDTNTTELEAIGEIKRNFDELNITVSGELLSHNRDYLAVWFNSQIELWSLKEKRVVNHFLHNGRVKQVIFSSDDSKIAARSYIEGTIGIWDTKSGFILSLFKEFPNANGIEFSKNGKELLCWGGDKSFLTQFKKPLAKVVLWDIDNNRVKAVFSHDDWIYGATFHNNEKEIWSWGYDRVLKILDKQSGKLLFKLYVKVPIYKVAFEENSNRFYTLSLGSKIKKAWSIYPKEREFNLEHTSKMIGLSFTKNGKRVLSWDNSGLIQLWKRKGFVKLASFRHHRAVWSAQFSKDEKYILAWGKDGLVRKWEIERGEEVEGEHTIEKKADIYELKTEREQISWRRGELEVIDLKEGTKVSLFHDTTVRLAHLNKKENLLLSCDQNSVNLWDIETKSKLLTFSHTDVIDAKFSDDEREIMSWGYDGNIKVFKLYKDRTLEFKDYLLEAEVHNGVELYNGRVNPLSVKEWKKRKSQYEERLK